MSLADAKRAMGWIRAAEAMKAAGIDEETIATLEKGQQCWDMVTGLTQMLYASADASKAKNFVSVQIAGLDAPWDRAYVELMRPGGKTPTELLGMRVAQIKELIAIARGGSYAAQQAVDAIEGSL